MSAVDKNGFQLNPVGRVRCSADSPGDQPHQGRGSDLEADLEIFPEFEPALREIAAGNMIWVFTWLHLADRSRLRGHPQGRVERPERGVFSLRSPHRPNPIGLHLVEVLENQGGRLRVLGMEAVDDTPILDIKPHIPRLDK